MYSEFLIRNVILPKDKSICFDIFMSYRREGMKEEVKTL